MPIFRIEDRRTGRSPHRNINDERTSQWQGNPDSGTLINDGAALTGAQAIELNQFLNALTGDSGEDLTEDSVSDHHGAALDAIGESVLTAPATRLDAHDLGSQIPARDDPASSS